METNILITGATGKIGSCLVNLFSEAGLPIRTLADTPEKAYTIQKENVDVVLADFSKPETLDPAFHSIHTLFLLTPAHHNQVIHQKNIIDAAKKAGVKKVVKVSAIGTAPESHLNIGKWHSQIESYIRDTTCMTYTFLHPHGFMQNLLMHLPTIQNEGKIYAPMSDGKVSYIDVKDIAEVAFKVLTEEGHSTNTYILTGPEALSFFEIAELLSQKLHKKITYLDIPEQEMHESMVNNGMPEWLADDLCLLYKMWSRSHGKGVSNTVEKILGRKATTFAEFIERNIEQFQPVSTI